MLYPASYFHILDATRESGFDMASDPLTCSLLRTLASSKPAGKFLELGTGTGLSTSWILDGMDKNSRLVSIDNSEKYLDVAKAFLSEDPRLDLVVTDGDEWIANHSGHKFDFIFADTWPGKYHLLDEVIGMLNPGGFYIIDDMLPQPNWPEGHDVKAQKLTDHLHERSDLNVIRLDWATGILICVKKHG